MTDYGTRVGRLTSQFLGRLNQSQVLVQEGKDLIRIQGVRGEVDNRSGQAFGHREIAGLKPPAVQPIRRRMQGGTEPVAQGDPGLYGRRLEGWAIDGEQLNFTDFCFESKSVKDGLATALAMSNRSALSDPW